MRQFAVGGATLALCLGSMAGTASAGESAPAGWNGRCTTMSATNTSFRGWCDGNGPERYATFVLCTGGEYHATYSKWYGDRTGVYAACPSGQRRTGHGYDHYV